LKAIEQKDNIENTFIIGGYALYYQAIKHDDCQCIYINVLDEYHDCDVFFSNYRRDKIQSNSYTKTYTKYYELYL
jgi:dihydrofolate reductase